MSLFYKRYVPPPKVPKIEEQPVKTAAVKPAEDSHHLPKRSKLARSSSVKVTKKPKFSAKIENGLLVEPELTGSSRKLSLAAPETVETPTEFVNQESEPNLAVEKHGLMPLPQPAQTEEDPRVLVTSALPEWIRAPTIASISIVTPFEQLGKEGFMSSKIISNLSKKGFTDANGLQSAIWPILSPGHQDRAPYSGDICISAATGSGKTLAYALPMIETLQRKAVSRLRGLIVVPTRELVDQAYETLEMCSAKTGIKIGTAVGNRNFKVEQTILVQTGQRWDPEGYRAEQEKEVDEDEDLMNWDFDAVLGPQHDFECWPNHVLEYSSKVDILICTPGRLVEHVKSTKGFHLQHVQWLVIDEADRLLAESFQEWVDIVIPRLEYSSPLDALEQTIYKTFHLSRQREMRKVVLSATMTRDIGQLMSLRLRHPRLVVLEGSREMDGIDGKRKEGFPQEERIELPNSLREVAIAVASVEDKPLYLLQVLSKLTKAKVKEQQKETEIMNGDTEMEDFVDSMDHMKADDEYPFSNLPSKTSRTGPREGERTFSGKLVFANSNESALRLARLLSILLPEQQIKALTKSPGGKEGRKTLQSFRRGELSVIVATDLASRGLDIPDLGDVINYDLPTSLKSYVHRVGRTARAGKEGKATTLVEHKQAKWFWNDIARTNHIVRARKVARMDQELQVGEQERKRYEDALRIVGKEVVGRSSEEKAEEM